MNEARPLPLHVVTLVFGALSIPLAFLRQLCVPAVIMAVLAIGFHLWGRWRTMRGAEFSGRSLKRSKLGFRLALAGALCVLTMWVLWATNVLLR